MIQITLNISCLILRSHTDSMVQEIALSRAGCPAIGLVGIAHTDGTQAVRSALAGTNQAVGVGTECGTFEVFSVASCSHKGAVLQ